jgi:hypothetical protein
MADSTLMAGRRILAVVCIAIVVVAGVLPGAAFVVCDALTPVDLLFGLVTSHDVPLAPDDALPSAPFLSLLPTRAPPAA